MDKILAFINDALQVGAKVIAAGKDSLPLAQMLASSFVTGREPTPEDFARLRALEAGLRADLQKPIPDDPDIV